MESKYVSLAIASQELDVTPEFLYLMGADGHFRIYKDQKLHIDVNDGYELVEVRIFDVDIPEGELNESFSDDELDMLGDKERAAVLDGGKDIFDEDISDGEFDEDKDPEDMRFFERYGKFLLIRKEDLQKLKARLPVPRSEAESLENNKIEDSPNKVIATPDGTEWNDITFRFIDYRKVKISFGNRTIERSFKSFDFSFNSKTKSPTKPWLHLLSLALHYGNPPKTGEKETDITPKHVSLIRGHLKDIFPGVAGEPIGEHKHGKGWPPKINLCVSESMSERYQE